jgi:hypothetical protein
MRRSFLFMEENMNLSAAAAPGAGAIPGQLLYPPFL